MEILKNRCIWKTSVYGGSPKSNFWNTVLNMPLYEENGLLILLSYLKECGLTLQ